MALAIISISASVLSFLKAFTAHKTNRQFARVYPASGMIRSMLGEKLWKPLPATSPEWNGMRVTSHAPVHLSMAHSVVKSCCKPFALALALDVSRSLAHG